MGSKARMGAQSEATSTVAGEALRERRTVAIARHYRK